MRRPASFKLGFSSVVVEARSVQSSRLCRHPSIRTLLWSDDRSVPGGPRETTRQAPKFGRVLISRPEG
jgi:hypothetical protein